MRQQKFPGPAIVPDGERDQLHRNILTLARQGATEHEISRTVGYPWAECAPILEAAGLRAPRMRSVTPAEVEAAELEDLARIMSTPPGQHEVPPGIFPSGTSDVLDAWRMIRRPA